MLHTCTAGNQQTNRGLLLKLDFNNVVNRTGSKSNALRDHFLNIGGGEIYTFRQLASAKLEVFYQWVTMSAVQYG